MKLRYRLLPVLIILSLLAVSLPQFLSPIVVLAAIDEFETSDDTFLREDEDYEHDGDDLRVGVVGSDGTSRTVLEFFVVWGVDIPTDATIVEATLILDPSSSSGDAMTLLCQRLKQNFSDGSADWSHYSGSLQWDMDGADGPDDYTTTDQASEYYSGSGLDPIEWDVTDIVDRQQQYEDNDVMFRIVAETEIAYDFINFDDADNLSPPILSIQYSYEADPTYAPTVTTGSYSDVTNTTAKLYGTTTYVDNGLAIYDDFEWGSSGDPLDDSGGRITWRVHLPDVEIDDSYKHGGTRSALFYKVDSSHPRAYFTYSSMGASETISFWVRKDNGSKLGIYHGDGTKLINCGIAGDERIYYYDGATTHYPGETVAVGDWHLFEITDVNWAAGTYDIYLDGWWCCTADMRTSASFDDRMVFYQSGSVGSSLWLDDLGFKPYVSDRGFQYGLTQTPTWTESEGGLFGTGAYNLNIDELSPNTEYWYRAFVTNDEGTAYGSWASFSTIGPPSISTVAASDVATTTARLNSALSSDGGDPCTIKFGWGLTSQSQVDDYDTTETLPGTYETGSNPYLDVSGLVSDQTYYFRVKATNDGGSTEGAQLTFDTISSLGPPTNFVGYPEPTSISLSWSKGTGSTNTLVRYSTGNYPTNTTSGTQAYFGPGSTHTAEDLTSGTTYYFSAWGESGGNYSSTYSTFLMTTSAGTEDDDDDPDVPTQPSRWFSAPDYTSMAGLLVIYDAINNIADTGQIPKETVWFLLALSLSFLAGLIAYLALGKKLMIAMIVLTVGLAMGYFVRLIPWWIPLMSLILVIAYSQTHKQVNEG